MSGLWKKDVAVVAGAVAVVFGGGILAQLVLGERGGILTAAIATAAGALVVLEVYRRLQIQLKEAAIEQHGALQATYRQLEALLSLTNTIRPTFPLPATRTWAASPDVLNQLCKLVLTHRPDQIFEVGSGVSTLMMAYCLRRVGKGTIVALENDPKFAAVTRQTLADHNLSDLVTVVDAPLKETVINNERWAWYDLARIPSTPPIDLLFIDGPPGMTQPLARYPALPILSSRLAPHAVIVLDDGARPDERAIAKRWEREFGMDSEYLYMEKGAHVFRRRSATR